MSSLAEVYEGLGEEASLEQLYAGTGLFLAGALMVVTGIVVATTGLLAAVGVPTWQAWELAGVLAGLGLPAVFVGVFVVLPADREVRAAAAVGASVAVLGVALFAHAFPERWMGDAPNLTPLVALVYGLGAIATFWCLFTAVANFQTRNDPGGTVTMEVTRGGETRVVEVDRDDVPAGVESDDRGTVPDTGGSVGVFGDDVSETVPTQTNHVEERTAGAVRTTDDPAPEPTPASDGGATEPGIRTPADDAEVLHSRPDPGDAADDYCGNCQYFEYVQTSRGMRPFCELQDGIMDDMDACEDWAPNRSE